MDMEIVFKGGLKVETRFKGFTVTTDQPVRDGGEGSAPTPFQMFLTSLGACAAVYVLRFCETRNLPTEGLKLVQHALPKPDGKGLGKVRLEIVLPPGFPEKYEKAVCRAADLCAVKKAIMNPPEFETVAVR